MRPLDNAVAPYLRAARVPLVGVLATSLLQGVLVVAQAFALAAAVVAVVDRRSVTTPATAVVVVIVLRSITAYASDALAAAAASRVTSTIRTRLLGAARARGPIWLGGRRSGELVALATRGATSVEPYLTRYLPALVLAVSLPVLTLAAIATQDLLAALIVLATLPLLPLFAALIGMTTKAKADRQWRELGTLAGHFLDVVRGLPTLVAFRRARAQTDAIRSATDRHRRATMATLRVAFASSTALDLIATLSVALVAVSVGLRLDAGHIGLQPALAALLLAPEAYWPIRKVGAEFHAAAEGTATFAAVSAIVGSVGLDSSATVPDTDTSAETGSKAPIGAIAVRGLEVRYPETAQIALRLPSADLVRGLNVVVGPSGAGKSTLLAALLGFVAPSAGSIHVDGESPAALDATWRQQVAWMPQRPWFTPGTIRDNLRLGRPDASDAELWAALDGVGLADVVGALPDGLDARLAEDGRSLSAGQRARLALARVVVADRPVVFVDEPTAHLDAASQDVVVRALGALAARSVVVAVSHRGELVAAADSVVTIESRTRVAASPSATTTDDADGGPTTAATPSSPAADRSFTDRVPRRMRLPLAALLGSLAAGCGVALTATSGWLIVRASERPPVLTLLVAIVGVRTFGLGRPMLRYAERLVAHDAALRQLAEARVRVYDALIPLTPGRLGRRRGDLLASVVDDVDAAVDRPVRIWLPTTSAVAVGLGTAAAALIWSASIGLVIVCLVAVGGTAFVAASATQRRAGSAAVVARADLTAAVADVVDGAAELDVWGHGSGSLVMDADRRLATIERRAAGRVAAARAAVTAAVGIATGAVVAIAAGLVESGSTTPALAALLTLLPLALADVLAPLPEAGALEPRTRAALDRVRSLEHAAPAVVDAVDPADAAGPDFLRIVDATAGWDGDDVLSGLNLEVAPGRRTAVVGPSGSGKSTLIALVARNIDPRAGSVTMRGADLRTWRLDDVRSVIGLIDDDPHIFGSTVYENVRLARPSATRADVLAALCLVCLGEWVDNLPRGLDTVIGDGGFDVSGGERARIALARALLADPAVLVLDEPTSHLDGVTASDVLDQVMDAWEGRSLVVSTHRADDLARFDDVLTLSSRGPALTSLRQNEDRSLGAERVPTSA
jgi:ATP-binding cassette, subfamily C, bacterial CydCD